MQTVDAEEVKAIFKDVIEIRDTPWNRAVKVTVIAPDDMNVLNLQGFQCPNLVCFQKREEPWTPGDKPGLLRPVAGETAIPPTPRAGSSII